MSDVLTPTPAGCLCPPNTWLLSCIVHGGHMKRMLEASSSAASPTPAVPVSAREVELAEALRMAIDAAHNFSTAADYNIAIGDEEDFVAALADAEAVLVGGGEDVGRTHALVPVEHCDDAASAFGFRSEADSPTLAPRMRALARAFAAAARGDQSVEWPETNA